MSEIAHVLNQSRPEYFWGGDVACTVVDGICCPPYCCSIMSTVHDLTNKPMNMAFKKTQKAYINGSFDVVKWKADGSGEYTAVINKYLEKAIYGGRYVCRRWR